MFSIGRKFNFLTQYPLRSMGCWPGFSRLLCSGFSFLVVAKWLSLLLMSISGSWSHVFFGLTFFFLYLGFRVGASLYYAWTISEKCFLSISSVLFDLLFGLGAVLFSATTGYCWWCLASGYGVSCVDKYL